MKSIFLIESTDNSFLLLSDLRLVANVSKADKYTIQHFIETIYDTINFSTNKSKSIDGIISAEYYGINLCIILSNRCELKCQYCYSQSGILNESPFVDSQKIKVVIDKIFNNYDTFKSFYTTPINILFHGGGEPTYNWSLLKNIVEYITIQKDRFNCPVKLRLQTNGILSSAQALWISEVFDEVVFSIDGPPLINDIMRPFSDGLPSTHISINAAKIVSKKIKVGIHAVVSGASKGLGGITTEYFLNEIKNLSFIHYEKYKPTQDGRNLALAISNEDFIDFVFDGFNIGGDIIRSSIIDTTLKKSFCKSCKGNIIYCFPNGNISLCNEHDTGKFVVGNFTNGIYIDKNKYIDNKNYLKEIIISLKCEDCFAFPFCKGGCRSFYMQSSNYKVQWCEMIKNALIRLFKIKLSQKDARSIDIGKHRITYNNL